MYKCNRGCLENIGPDLYKSTLEGEDLDLFDNQSLTLDAFKDYKPQINVMPRLAFSFPISEDAGFYAHYDVLTQRPSDNAIRPSDFYYLNQIDLY